MSESIPKKINIFKRAMEFLPVVLNLCVLIYIIVAGFRPELIDDVYLFTIFTLYICDFFFHIFSILTFFVKTIRGVLVVSIFMALFVVCAYISLQDIAILVVYGSLVLGRLQASYWGDDPYYQRKWSGLGILGLMAWMFSMFFGMATNNLLYSLIAYFIMLILAELFFIILTNKKDPTKPF